LRKKGKSGRQADFVAGILVRAWMLDEPSVTRSQLARVIRKASDHMLTDGFQRGRISPRALLWSLGAWSVRYGLALWLATNNDATAEQGVLESFAIVAGVSAHARSAPQWRHLPRLEPGSSSPLNPRPPGHNGNHKRSWRSLSVAVRTLGQHHNSCRQLIMTVSAAITV